MRCRQAGKERQTHRLYLILRRAGAIDEEHELRPRSEDIRHHLAIHQLKSLGHVGFVIGVLDAFPVALTELSEGVASRGRAVDFSGARLQDHHSAKQLPTSVRPRARGWSPHEVGHGLQEILAWGRIALAFSWECPLDMA